MRARHFIPLIVTACLIAVSFSCGTQRKVSGKRQQEAIEQAIKQINAATHSLDARCSIQTGSFRIKGQMKVNEDSCLWLSAQFLGMEAGRALLTDNSIQVIYRPQKLFFRQVGWEHLPLARRCANAVFLHKIILPDGKEPTLSDFITVRTDDGGWQLIRHGSFGTLTYNLDSQLQLTESQCDIDGHEIKAVYSSFEDGFPSHIALTAPADNFSVGFSLSKIVRNSTPDIGFNIPQGYIEAPVGQLMRMLNLK